MIICPACKEEIEDDSHYCDQCGQQLLFCKQCGHVGLGRRCTCCGGMMASRDGAPILTLANDSLRIHVVAMDGAVIGRREGPYVHFFEQYSYVSGIHAQLKYEPSSGWCVIDKHSSNGTRVNQRPIQPDVEVLLNNGDVLTIANINLQVMIK